MSSAEQTQTIAIVGAGQAGGETAAELRKLGFDGRIVLIGDEPQVPYRRPPLSKAFLSGKTTEESLYITSPAGWQKRGVDFIGSTRVVAIDRGAGQLRFADGRGLAYDTLVLATGGRARTLDLPGAAKRNVFTIRSIADVLALRPYCQPGKRAVVIGGGFIGMETAAVLASLQLQVTVLEGMPRVLARVTVPEVSTFFERLHRDAGVDLRTGVKIAALAGGNEVERVELDDGGSIVADFVIVGIGQLPNVELAANAGLRVDDGIVVDEFGRTDDPAIYAAGDCANHPNAFYGHRLRLESVQNAIEHARAVAANVLGDPLSYNVVPWFWSDQYDAKLQMVGISRGYEEIVVRGDLTGHAFAVFYLKDGRMIAADTVGRPQDFSLAKKLVAARTQVSAAMLEADSIPLSA